MAPFSLGLAVAQQIVDEAIRDARRLEVRISVAVADEAGSLAAAKAKGRLRVEGKDYVVQEGDIVHVRFAV